MDPAQGVQPSSAFAGVTAGEIQIALSSKLNNNCADFLYCVTSFLMLLTAVEVYHLQTNSSNTNLYNIGCLKKECCRNRSIFSHFTEAFFLHSCVLNTSLTWKVNGAVSHERMGVLSYWIIPDWSLIMGKLIVRAVAARKTVFKLCHIVPANHISCHADTYVNVAKCETQRDTTVLLH